MQLCNRIIGGTQTIRDDAEGILPLQQQQTAENGTQPLMVKLSAQEAPDIGKRDAEPVVEGERQTYDVIPALIARPSGAGKSGSSADNIVEDIKQRAATEIGDSRSAVRPTQAELITVRRPEKRCEASADSFGSAGPSWKHSVA